MPAEGEERGEIGMVKPAGWHTVKYPDVISDLYLYNRCHLIGWQLCAENANVLNLTTGTRYLNVEGMLPFENQVDDYIDETGNHVLYRVTPIFVDDELVCRGILMEAKSIEDDDCVFCVYCYNVQPRIGIDYKTGESSQLPDVSKETAGEKMYVLNNSSKKVHVENCDYVKKMSEENREDYYGTLDEILENGFTACGSCKPE
jgi:DNA-entry nuclease